MMGRLTSRQVETVEREFSTTFIVVVGLPYENMVCEVDVQSSFFFLAVTVAVAFNENVLVCAVVGGRLGFALLAIWVPWLVESLEDSRHGVRESLCSFGLC
jgi:hypothetical protein